MTVDLIRKKIKLFGMATSLSGNGVVDSGLFMHVGTDHCSWLDERTDFNNVVGTIMINQ